MTKLTKKNKGKKGDPEGEYSKPLPGAPAGQNIAKSFKEGFHGKSRRK